MRPVLFSFLLFFCSLAVAQETGAAPAEATAKAQAARPKIGLVLEGGGALGLAHVGVLQWFQQHHIPVDGVAGTSMGGLVGSLYATGMSGDEIRKFVDHLDWDVALRNETPYQDLSFRRKEDKREYPNTLELGLKHGVSFPSGFNSGHQVGLIIDRITLPYSNLESFDDLPTSFRCVASDLVSGKATVFDHGSLEQALRATMSLPAVFSPVRDGEHVYVDGGLLDNLPADVVRRMGMDVVIAVHLRTQPLDPKAPLSVFGVLERSVSVVVSVTELEGMEKADILITVPTEKYTSTDYGQANDIITAGFNAAQERSAVLERFALSDDDWKQYVAAREARKRTVPVPQFVKVTGVDPATANGMERHLQGLASKPVDTDRLDQEMTLITGTGRFERVGFQMTERNGEPGLLVHADEKDYAPPTLKPLILIDGSDYEDVRFSLGARITLFDIGGFGSEWRNDLIAGSQYGVTTEYYHPLRRNSRFFVAPRAFANNTPFDIYSDDMRVATYRERSLGAGLDFGIAFNRFSEFRLGYQDEHFNFAKQIGAQDLPNEAGRQGVTQLRYRMDYTDDPTVPRQGFALQSRFAFYDANPGATEDFPEGEIRTGIFHRISNPASVFLLASGGSTFGFTNIGLPPFSLGGPGRLAAYGPNEFLSDQYFLFQPGYLHRLTQLSPLLGNNVYFIGTYEIAKAYHNAFSATGESRLPMDVSAVILVQTFLGPIAVGGSVGDSGHHKFYFQVGRYF
jgi:NTE family protein